jgi:hypothetical protein
MSTEVTKILTDDESSIISLLVHVDHESDEFDDPENGDYLDRMEALFRGATELDATVVKIAIDRTHFFRGEWFESDFSGDSYHVIPETSPATDRLHEALESTTVIESEGVKVEVLEIVDRLQIDYFWRDSSNPDPAILQDLIELITEHNIKDEELSEFVQWGILFPWHDYLQIDYVEITNENTVHPDNEQIAEWCHLGRALTATRW